MEGRKCYMLSHDGVLGIASKIDDWEKSVQGRPKTMSTYANGMEIIVRNQSNNGRETFEVTCWSEEKDGLGRSIFLGSANQVDAESMPRLYNRLMA
jgi:hypothetical protein